MKRDYCIYTKTAGDKEHREPLNLWNSKIEYIYIYIYIYSNRKCSWKQIIRGIHKKYIVSTCMKSFVHFVQIYV